jgi:uncharacterized protein YbjT (DUF2867 family)
MFVVAGSSGNTGSVVADTLLKRGQRVRLIVRHPERVATLAARGAELVVADFEDTRAITEALRGARGAYLLIPPAMTSPDVLAFHARVAASFATAIREARPEHVVLLSSLGAHLDQPVGPVVSLQAAERALASVCEHVTFVRPAYFMENIEAARASLPLGVYPTFLRAELPIPMVATRDVGLLAAEALLRGPSGRAVIELEGPHRYSAVDIARELSSVLGTPLRIHEAPESAVVPALVGMGLPKLVAELTEQMFHALNHGMLTGELPELSRARGATTLQELVTQRFAPSRRSL